MKLAICNELFENWEIENVISFCADLGYDGIEIAPFTLAEWPNELSLKRREALRNFAVNHKIDLVGLHWLLAGPDGLSISSPNPETRKFTQQYLVELIDLCADLGGTRMVFGSPNQRNIGPNQAFSEVWQYAATIFSEIMEQAEAREVTLCFEPLSPVETNFIRTAAEGIKLVDEIKHPNFMLHLDVKAMTYEHKTIPQIILESNQYIRHFHVNDKEGHEPGFGKLDFKPILDALRAIDYHGFISVEAFDFTDGAEKIATRAYKYLSGIL